MPVHAVTVGDSESASLSSVNTGKPRKHSAQPQPSAKALEAPANVRPSRASKIAARNVIAAVTQAGRKRTHPGKRHQTQPAELPIKKAKTANNTRVPTTTMPVRQPNAQSSVPAATNRNSVKAVVDRTKMPRVKVSLEDSPMAKSDNQPHSPVESDEEPLVISATRFKSKSAMVAHQQGKSVTASPPTDHRNNHSASFILADNSFGEEGASSNNGSYSPNEGSNEGSGMETEDELTMDDEDEDDILSQDLAALETRLAAKKPVWKGQGEYDDDEEEPELPPILRRKQNSQLKNKGKGKALLTIDNTSSDGEAERILEWALVPRHESQRQAESGGSTSSIVKPKPATERQLIERPAWKDDTPSSPAKSVHYHSLPSDFASIVDSEDDRPSAGAADDLSAPIHIPDILPPASYELVYPATPGAHLHLLQQHIHIICILQRMFLSNERTLILTNAFPPAHERHQVVLKGMLDACTDQGYSGLYTRILTDVTFCKSLAALPNQRISVFHSNIKKVSDAHIIAFYGLQPGAACATKVEWLLQHLRYIYPHSYEKNTANWRQPFHHPAVPSIMRATYWTGASAVGLREQDSDLVFDSCRDDRLGELEVPALMVALVGAAIHASLSEWKTGYYKKSFFMADAFINAYNELITILDGIKDSNLNGYHFMMHWLFKEASGTAPSQAPNVTSTTVANALAMIDFTNMDID